MRKLPSRLDGPDDDWLHPADDFVVEDGAGGPHHARADLGLVGGRDGQLVDVGGGHRQVDGCLAAQLGRGDHSPVQLTVALLYIETIHIS